MNLYTCLTPRNITIDLLAGATAVVIDALRMTSTAVTALANGCTGILPVAGVEEARVLAQGMPDALLCGERKGMPLEGFVLGNSPLEYTPERVQGRRIISSTTNGTRVLCMAAPASTVLLGAFLNAAALARRVCSAEKLVFLCAGTYDAFSMEDVVAAGRMIADLQKLGVNPTLDDASEAAVCLYEAGKADVMDMLQRRSAHCRYLLSLGKGMADDVRYCVQEDVADMVPVLRNGWVVDERSPVGDYCVPTK